MRADLMTASSERIEMGVKTKFFEEQTHYAANLFEIFNLLLGSRRCIILTCITWSGQFSESKKLEYDGATR